MFLSRTALFLATCMGAFAAPQIDFQPRNQHLVEDLRAEVRDARYRPLNDASSCTPYWMEQIKHQGIASFNPNAANYTIFRNVKDYGAKGDGVTDDTAAINRAISEGGRCGPGVCQSTTTSPAVVYFPEGTYMLSSGLVNYYYTQIIGNPNCLPTLKATPNFAVGNGAPLGLIDGSQYQPGGVRGFIPQNVFFRQIRNLIVDTTNVPAGLNVRGIHWPTAQTTSIQNVVFNLSGADGTQHEGLFIEEGSGGFMTDLVFNGGRYGFNVGNQQFTTRNLTFNNCVTAINQLWDWGWTYKSVSINNCQVGLDITAGAPSLSAGSITFIDSEITNTPVGILTARTQSSEPDAAGSLYLENVRLQNVPVAVKAPNGTALAGSSGSMTIQAWADGHRYDHSKQMVETRGSLPATNRPSSLLDSQGKYYERSKPQYGEVSIKNFISARSEGAKGDGVTDDTEALNKAIRNASRHNKVLFVDAGFYKVTGTIYIPAGSKIVGEALASVILSSGPFFSNAEEPQPVVQVGFKGEHGSIEWSDMFVSTQGPQEGAILIEYNLFNTGSNPSGMWDLHTRIGGFAGSQLKVEQCPTTPNVVTTPENLKKECIGAYMSMHVTKWASNLYMENNWLWVADHDLDDPANNNTQITIYAGRGLLIESLQGRIWLYGTAVEHHVKYEYQFVDTRNVFAGQIQTETAYYQPNPAAPIPFLTNDIARSDPVFPSVPPLSIPSNSTTTQSISGWGLRILRSNTLNFYGAGLYSFFNNYSTTCSSAEGAASCQAAIASIEGGALSWGLNMYNLNTIGSRWMVVRDEEGIVWFKDNVAGFADTVNVLRV